MNYVEMLDGVWLAPKRRGFRFSCCDCGLVHNMVFRLIKGQIQFKTTADKRATGQRRRHMGVKIEEIERCQ